MFRFITHRKEVTAQAGVVAMLSAKQRADPQLRSGCGRIEPL
jgi:hypothetical protein